MEEAKFVDLPTELICFILQQLTSLQDLQSIILASAQIHDIFASFKVVILSNLAKNLVPPEVFADALTAVRYALLNIRFRETDVREPEVVTEFLQVREEVISRPISNLFSVAESTALCRLHSSNVYFIKQYCADTLPKVWIAGMQSRSDDSQPHNSAGARDRLTRTEFGRLYRAFCRYEIFQNVLHPRISWLGGVSGVVRRGSLFCAKSGYSSWEMEEIGCVRQWIKGRWENAFNDLEEQFIGDFKHADAETRQQMILDLKDAGDDVGISSSTLTSIWPKQHPQTPGCRTEQCSPCLPFCSHRPTGFFTVRGRFQQKRTLIYLTRCPLFYQQRFFESDRKTRLKIATTARDRGPHFDHAFTNGEYPQHGPIALERAAKERGDIVRFETDALPLRNRAWVWAASGCAEPLYYQRESYNLRGWGYVFWDSARLEESGRLKTRREIDVEREAFYEKRFRGLEPSAEERLRDMCLI
jgi:hypothetical protein